MKIIIGQGSVKREIEGPFSICCDRKTLENIEAACRDALCKIDGDGVYTHTYGWVRIAERIIDDLEPGHATPWSEPK